MRGLNCPIVTLFLFFADSQALSELTELLSSRSNYVNYRRVYNECSGFKVPILGVHLKDLISLNEALPDYISEDKINLSKLQHLYSNISDLLAIHSCTPPFEANKDLLHLLTVGQNLSDDLQEGYNSQWSHRDFVSSPLNPSALPGLILHRRWDLRTVVHQGTQKPQDPGQSDAELSQVHSRYSLVSH